MKKELKEQQMCIYLTFAIGYRLV